MTIPDIPSGYKGNLRTFAAILYVALRRARYTPYFLYSLYSEVPQGLGIGLSGSTFIVGNIKDPSAFPMATAEQCAKALNAEFGKVTSAASKLATARKGRTVIGGTGYAEVTMQCPNRLKLQLLRRGFL